MKKEALYHKTVDILVQAYFNDTLQLGDCNACAVGNLVAANMGYKYTRCLDWENSTGAYVSTQWDEVHCVSHEPDMNNYFGEAKKQIDSTGYSPHETCRIEYAFEAAPIGNSNEDYMFNGLMAVIEVLDQIHENTDTSITTASKNRFDKTLA